MSLDLPFMRFYPNDWLADQGLRMCSLAARGLWTDLLCLMWKAPRRGYLEVVAGVPLTDDQIARAVGIDTKSATALVSELEVAGVPSREAGTGVMYSRRIVKDVAFLAACTEAGRKGGNPHLKGGVNPRLNKPVTANHTPCLKPQKVRGSDIQNTELKEESLRSSSSAEPEQGPAPAVWNDERQNGKDDPIAYAFPAVGKITNWPLRSSKVSEYRATFSGVDIDSELRKALQWCRDNPKRRKTASGMPKFLFGWLERAQNSNRSPRDAATPNRPTTWAPANLADNYAAADRRFDPYTPIEGFRSFLSECHPDYTIPTAWDQLPQCMRQEVVNARRKSTDEEWQPHVHGDLRIAADKGVQEGTA